MTDKPTYEELEQRIKDLEQELVKRHEVEKELNLTLDATTEGIWSWKFKTNDFYFSPQYYKMLGYKPDEFSPDFENWLDLIHPDDREKSLEIANEFLKSKPDLYENEFRLRTKNDGYRWIKTVGKVVERDESGDAVYMIGNHEDITEIKSALNALIEERERFELAMKFTNDGIFDWNLETNEIHYSSGWKRMLGYNDDEIKNEFSEWERLTKFEDMKASWDMMNELLEGKRDHFEKEFKMQHKDGHWVDILSRANVVFNEDGKGVRVVGTHVDITERKRIEGALRESEARFKALHNASFGGIAIHDKGVILECNQGLSEMTGYSMTELTEMDGLLLIAEKSRNFVMQNILSGYEKPYEAFGLRKNGEEYPIRLEGRNIPYKGKNVRVVEFRDITEQKRVENELRLTQYSINHIADSIFWIDKSADFLFVNDAACNNLGYSREELIKMNVFDVDPVFPKEKLEEHWESISKPNAVVVVETIHKTKDGRQFPVEVTTNLLEYEGKQYNVAVARDITARRQAEMNEKELEAANLRLQKAESLSQMAGGIAHLFNNYLYAVIGNLEMALEELPNDALIHNYLIQAVKAANRCADVSRSMLTYLGQNFVKTESIDISKFCQTHLPILQLSFNNNITIETNLSDSELVVRANAGQMQQILNHLITNAFESIGKNKGRINLTTKTIPASDISKFHLLPVDSKPSAERYVCLEVADTGCGIPKQDIDRISDPFFTTKFTGRGLGLAVVSGIVKSWGGMIGVRSKVGHGSTFMVFIPYRVSN